MGVGAGSVTVTVGATFVRVTVCATAGAGGSGQVEKLRARLRPQRTVTMMRITEVMISSVSILFIMTDSERLCESVLLVTVEGASFFVEGGGFDFSVRVMVCW